MTALVLVHALHVLAGVVWAGGQVVMALGVWPAIRARPAPEARALLAALAGPLGRLMATSSGAVLVLGLLRGTWLGPIRGVDALATPYGATFLVATAVTVGLAARGAGTEARLARLFNGDAYAADAGRRLAVEHAVDVGAVVILVACMALMHFGL